jgi:hypothetical protein
MKDDRDGTCAIYEEKKNVYRSLVGKPEVKRPTWKTQV